MPDFRMPSLGADMDVGTVLEWLVAPGDRVHKGDPVAVVDTAKAAVEVEVFSDGVVEELVVPVGEQVAVGTLLARLRPLDADAGAAPEPEPAPAPVPAARPAPPVPEPAAAPRDSSIPVASPLVRHLAHQRGVDLASVAGAVAGVVTRQDVERTAAPVARETRGATRGSPYARRRATELGVDLATITGSGRDGAVRAADVERAAAERVPGPRPGEPGEPVDRRPTARRAIAALMSRSKREVPHYYLTETVDLATATAWLHARNRDRPVPERVLTAALVVKSVALACRAHPELNGAWRDDRFEPADAVHVGLAVALRGGGLVTPALLDADRLPVDEVMAGLRDLVARARAGRLRRRELTDATITVTNLGEQGAESVHGVIYPPQVALVGVGRVVERPWAVDGLLGVRPVVTTTLAADHRATDGHVGGRFLREIARLLQVPEELDRRSP